MKNQIIIVFILFIFIKIGYAQTNFSINGKVLTKENKVIASAQITLVNNKNEVIKIEITDNEGTFNFKNIKEGNYKVFVDDLEHKAYESEIIALNSDNPNLSLSSIVLMPNAMTNLDEVVVTKKKPFVENKIDRTVVNVDAFITAAGGDAMDILEKSPGILVDQNGTITFKGKSGVQVFIDDKPTYLSSSELEAYLKSLPASTLDKIELMTNPPAKYDAAGGAGIINIVSKRSKSKGFMEH